MLTCDGCATTLFVKDSALLSAGHAGDMHAGPQLFGLGDCVRFGKTRVTLLGHARFSYGRGWWDEYWGTDARGEGVWVSVDEGDIVLQRPLPRDERPMIGRTAKLGSLTMFRGEELHVTERDSATCIAVRGSFDEMLAIGETYQFVNLEGSGGMMLSGEFSEAGPAWFIGSWFDPFEIEIVIAP